MTDIVTDKGVLSQISRETNIGEVTQLGLVAHIKESLKHAWCPGCGLAAIQLGIPIRAAWYRLTPEDGVGVLLLNPKILSRSGLMVHPDEGCLSIPGVYIPTQRYSCITLENDGHVREVNGFEAIVVQHEVDHMDGILNTEREYKSDSFGRNSPCPCGSGKKYKKCCLN